MGNPKTKLILIKILLLFFATPACAKGMGFWAEKFHINRDQSLFEEYAGQKCRVALSRNDFGNEIPCEELKTYLDHHAAPCLTPTAPRFGFFPEKNQPMHLCRSYGREQRAQSNVIRFAVLGDMGQGENTRRGYRQQKVADIMHAICPPRQQRIADEGGSESRPCDFVLGLGDLIYPSGVTDVWDKELRNKFEDTYKAFGVFDFYLVPGNHDYRGNVQAEEEYTWFSDRWLMPKRHFAVWDLPPWLHIYGIDTTPLVSEGYGPQEGQAAAFEKAICRQNGWKVVFGHHVPASSGMHGPQQQLKQWLAKRNGGCAFDVYWGGHDHHQEHLQGLPYDVMIQGGGGANVREPRDNEDPALKQLFSRAAHGFAIVEAREESMDVYFYDIAVWDERERRPTFKEHVYHCRFERGQPGCRQQM